MRGPAFPRPSWSTFSTGSIPSARRTSGSASIPASGLSISRQIVEALKGRISAENRRDAQGAILGARFIVRLPAPQDVKRAIAAA